MKSIALLFFLILMGCKTDPIKKFKLDNELTIDVSSNIIDFETGQILTSPLVTISGKFLILTDLKSNTGKGIHIFDNCNLEYLASTGILGEGPGEIINYGEIGITPNENIFWMPDFGKIKMFKFDIDSILMDENYLPTISIPFQYDFFLSRLKFISNDIALGTGVEVLSTSTFRTSLGKWDLNTGKVEKFGYEHPKLKNERTNGYFDYSYKHQIMALSYVNFDIITIFDFDGNVKFNIIGEKEFDNQNRQLEFFGQIHIGENKIFTRYLGKEGVVYDEYTKPKSIQASKILIFDLNGNLIKILETGHEIRYFTVDEEYGRIFCYFLDRKVPIGYFYLE